MPSALIVFGVLGAALFLGTIPKLAAMQRDSSHVYRAAVIGINVGGATMVVEAAYGHLVGMGVIMAILGAVVALMSRPDDHSHP